jgi:hypothetical protein
MEPRPDEWYRNLAAEFGCGQFDIDYTYVFFRMGAVADTTRDGRRAISTRLTYLDDRATPVGHVGFAAAQLGVRHPDVAACRPVEGALELGRDSCGNDLADHLAAVTAESDGALKAGVYSGFVGVAGYEASPERVADLARGLGARIDLAGDIEAPADPQPVKRCGGPLAGEERYEFPQSLVGVPADAGLHRVHIRHAFGAEIGQYLELRWRPTPRPPRGWRFWRQEAPRNWPDWDHLRRQADRAGATAPWIVLGDARMDGSVALRSIDLLDCADRPAAEAGYASAVARVLSSQVG